MPVHPRHSPYDFFGITVSGAISSTWWREQLLLFPSCMPLRRGGGFAGVGDRQRLERLVARLRRMGYLPTDFPSVQTLAEEADRNLFKTISQCPSHVLRHLLTDKPTCESQVGIGINLVLNLGDLRSGSKKFDFSRQISEKCRFLRKKSFSKQTFLMTFLVINSKIFDISETELAIYTYFCYFPGK